MRKVKGLATVFIGLMLLLYAGGTAYAGGNGGHHANNNGTVKIHEGATESEPLMRNEPHVCTFHVHGFKFDGNSTGWWRIEMWAPSGSGVASSGTWAADGDGNWRTAVMTLADGHYKLFADQNGSNGGAKHKVFWVRCAGTTGETTAGTTAGTTGETTGETTAGTTAGTTGGTTAGTTAGTTGGTTAGTTAGTTGGTTAGTTGATTVTTTAGTTSGTTAATTGGAAGTTGGAQGATTGGVESASTGASLPSTSTDNNGALAGGLGAILIALGGFMLWRPSRKIG